MSPTTAENGLRLSRISDRHDSESQQSWVADPYQLSRWQGQLVSFCEDISEQLCQIRRDLTQEQPSPIRLFATSGLESE